MTEEVSERADLARVRAEAERAAHALREARDRRAGQPALRLLRDHLTALLAELRRLRGRPT